MKQFRALAVAPLALTIAAAPALSADAGAARKKPLKIVSGKTTLSFDGAFVRKVLGLGVVPAPIAPTKTGATITDLVFPVGSGKVDAAGKVATVKHKGGLRLASQTTGTVRTLTSLTAKIKGTKLTVLGNAGTDAGVLLTGVPFLKGTVSGVRKTNRSYTASAARLTLTEEAAADLNSQFGNGRQVFTAGELVGSGRIIAKK